MLGADPIANSKFEELIANVTLGRSSFFQQLFDPRRNIDDECGYPASEAQINIEQYRILYDREPIAARVVEVMPKESWQELPTIYEDEDADNITDFEEAWDNLGRGLANNGKSWHQDESGSPIWEHLIRADILSGIGHFGIILLGIDDGQNLETPVDGVLDTTADAPATSNDLKAIEALPNLSSDERRVLANMEQETADFVRNRANQLPRPNSGTPVPDEVDPPGGILSGTDQQYFGVQFGPPEKLSDGVTKGEPRRLLFLRTFDESLVQIVRYEWNIRNPRFGQPVMYRVTLNDPREQHSGVGLPLATVFVHWSRIIHIADNLHSSEIFGYPRMRQVLNRLLDIQKVSGGSGEMYWRGAFPGISLETNPQLGGEVDVDQLGLQNMMENYMNGLQRYLALMGMTAKTLAPQVVSPKEQLEAMIEQVCIKLGIPIRVFKGSERGELASSQDDSSWNDRVDSRRITYLTPRVIVPFVDRLIMVRVLPEPEGYSVNWPDLDSTTDSQKAGIAVQRTQALVQYVGGGGEQVMAPQDFFVRIMGFTEEEAKEIVKAAQKNMEEEMQDAQDTADEHGFVPAPPEGFQHPPAPPSPVKVKAGEKLVTPPAAPGAPPPKPPAQGGAGGDQTS